MTLMTPPYIHIGVAEGLIPVLKNWGDVHLTSPFGEFHRKTKVNFGSIGRTTGSEGFLGDCLKGMK